MKALFLGPFERAWHFRELIQTILWRELAVRFRHSYFSWGWAILSPLIILGLYTMVLSNTLRVSSATEAVVLPSALNVFTGLIIFNLAAELLSRSPTLMHEHAQFLKKSIFPSEMLIWIAVFRALAYAGIGLAVLLVFEIALTGRIPWSALLLPFVIVPLCLQTLGVAWFLAALGAFTRDIAYLVVTFIPVMLFATPVFYTLADVPESLRIYSYLNPLTAYIEMSRNLLLKGTWPDPALYMTCAVVSVCVFVGGNAFFVRYRNVIIDVI